MSVAGRFGKRGGAIRGHGSVNTELKKLDATTKAQVALEVEGEKTGVTRLREDGVEVSQGGEGGVLELMVGGGVSGSVVTERGLLIQRVKGNGGSRDKSARRRRREHRDELSGGEAASCTGGLVIEGRVIGVVEVELGRRRVRRTANGKPVSGDRVKADAGERRLGR